jgi:hypothetical protein
VPDSRRPGQFRKRRIIISDGSPAVSAAHAIETMIAGWIGYGLAGLAYKQGKRE